MASGITAPANKPETARSSTSAISPRAPTQAATDTPYRPSATQITRSLPTRSPSGPKASWPMPYGSMKPAMTAAPLATLTSRLRARSGNSGSSSRMPDPEANPAAASSATGVRVGCVWIAGLLTPPVCHPPCGAATKRRSTHRGDGVAVLRPGFWRRSRVRRAVLAVADDLQPAGADAVRRQIVGVGRGAALAEGEVVLLGSPLVAVAGDHHVDRREALEPGRLSVERGARRVVERAAIGREEDAVPDGLHQVFLASRHRLAGRVATGARTAARAAGSGIGAGIGGRARGQQRGEHDKAEGAVTHGRPFLSTTRRRSVLGRNCGAIVKTLCAIIASRVARVVRLGDGWNECFRAGGGRRRESAARPDRPL